MINPYDILTTGDRHKSRLDSPECTLAVKMKVADLAERVTKLLEFLGFAHVDTKDVTSGFRTRASNKAAGGAPNSAHLTGEAVDIADSTGTIARAILADPSVLQRFDLYIENPQQTSGWIHFTTRAPKSGNRIFLK